MKLSRFLLLLPLLSFSKCPMEPAPQFSLPPATTEGANTMGFMVDGRTWGNYDGSYDGSSAPMAYYNRQSGQFSLEARLYAKDVNEAFSLSIDSLRQAGTFPTTYRAEPGATYRAVRNLAFSANGSADIYSSQERGSVGSITISRLDTVQRIVAGTFSGNLYRSGSRSKSVSISEGRFDLHY
jgi:hypothetical protein